MTQAILQVQPNETQNIELTQVGQNEPLKKVQKTDPMWAILGSYAQLRGILTKNVLDSSKTTNDLFDVQNTVGDWEKNVLDEISAENSAVDKVLNTINGLNNTTLNIALGLLTVGAAIAGFLIGGPAGAVLGVVAMLSLGAQGVLQMVSGACQYMEGNIIKKRAAAETSLNKANVTTKNITDTTNFLYSKINTNIQSQGNLDSLINDDMSAWGQAMKGISRSVINGLKQS